MNLFKKCVAEFIGTAVLVCLACGVAVWTNASVVATSLAFGLVIVAMAYSIGNISGCHINPAVSFAMFIARKINGKELIGYIVAQCLGALVGALLLGTFLGGFKTLGGNAIQATITSAYASQTIQYLVAFLLETILTFIFVMAILGVTSKSKYVAISGVVIGLALTLVHLFGIGFTGTSVNPARSLGPAVLEAIGGNMNSLKQLWIFLIAPLVGALLASIMYRGFRHES
ncbi:MAG: aquaporin [Anaeroplasma bactoclasticum]|nr:aquaporin [Staphylococcus sp.]MCM1350258.1 aquaporin [Prevotella sp.]MCM1513819.1 aquaporin [Anaeroplasma bactoclasticum]